MAGHNDPRLLYSIHGIRAYHLQNGEETPLTPSGAQTLSLLMVPTSSPFADLSNTYAQNEVPEEDFYLHLNLPPELDLPLPATTQIYHQPPRSYLIPRWDLGPESGAFTRIEFPSLGSGPGQVTQEDIDTFETILAQCTAFLERAKAPSTEKGKLASYNPAEYSAGEAYVRGTGSSHHGQIVLVDEDDGSVVGELTDGAQVIEDSNLKPGMKGKCSGPHSVNQRISTNRLLQTQSRFKSLRMESVSKCVPSVRTIFVWPNILPTATAAWYRTQPQHRASLSLARRISQT